MAITSKINQGGNGINYTKETDSSIDWSGITNGTYFRDLTDGLIHYKDNTGVVLEIFFPPGSILSGGTLNYISKFTSSTAIGNSLLYDNGVNVGFGTTSFGTSGSTVFAQVNGIAPTTSPANQIQAYSDGGVWKYRDSSGNTITI